MKILDLAREIIRIGRENPDFVYDPGPTDYDSSIPASCRYLYDNGEGACIVGKALINLGLDKKILEAADNQIITTAMGVSATELINDYVEDGDYRLTELIDEVQTHQDSYVPWGKAIAELEEEISLRNIGN